MEMKASFVDFYAVVLMVLWFSLSCSIAILNKLIFLRLEFVFPVTLTAYHMFAQSVQAYVVLRFTKLVDTEWSNLPKEVYRRSVLPVASIMCIEVVFNNMGLRYIPVSFVQTLRSLTPLCAALCARLVLKKKLSSRASLSLVPITIGVSLSTYEELSFHMGGFCVTILSCFLTAGKLALTSELMVGVAKIDPVSALLYMCPIGFVIASPIAFLLEGRALFQWIEINGGSSLSFCIVLSSALFAFALNLSIFFLLRRTSAVTVAVAGNFKVAVTVLLSVVIFRNPLSHLGWVGCGIALVGCTSYGLIQKKFVD
jgi:solute carrier family 35, member E3